MRGFRGGFAGSGAVTSLNWLMISETVHSPGRSGGAASTRPTRNPLRLMPATHGYDPTIEGDRPAWIPRC